MLRKKEDEADISFVLHISVYICSYTQKEGLPFYVLPKEM